MIQFPIYNVLSFLLTSNNVTQANHQVMAARESVRKNKNKNLTKV